MSTTRHVVLGAARPRSAWFAAVAQWSHGAVVPIDFVKCLGAEDLRAHLASGRDVTAALVDGGMPGIDRDLIDDAHRAGVAVIVVADPRAPVEWEALGADGVLAEPLDPSSLLHECTRTARSPRPRANHWSAAGQRHEREAPTDSEPPRGALIAVIGGGGAGTSTVAMAVAQGLASPGRARHRRGHARSLPRSVLLADLCRDGELGMLHDTDAVSPGLQELLELHRTSTMRVDDVRSLCFSVPERGYALLLGLRRARLWSVIRASTTTSAIGSLRASFDAVVTDVDADLEGEEECGSTDVEDRHLLARSAVLHADAVLAVGDASLKGMHTLVRVVRELVSIGVEPTRIQPVVNRAPDGRRSRAELTAALAHLAPRSREGAAVRPPVFLPVRDIDGCNRRVDELPEAITAPATASLLPLLGRPAATPPPPEAHRVIPGSLGTRGSGHRDLGAPHGRFA